MISKSYPPPPPHGADLALFKQSHPFLVVDTSLYPPDFQAALLSELSAGGHFADGIDAAVNGLLIHADNFQALNLLQARYCGQVKCIYIDPPYNTGSDGFIYKDNYRHSSWLSLNHSRLVLSHALLNAAGVFFQSIDDNEQARAKLLCDEIFGEENFIAEFSIASNSSKNNSTLVSINHEYAICYAKEINNLTENWKVPKNQVKAYETKTKQLLKMGLSEEEVHEELLQLVKYPRFYDFDHYTYVDKNGIYQTSDPGGVDNGNFKTEIIHPITGKPCTKPSGGWRDSDATLKKMLAENRIAFGKDETVIPRIKRYLHDYLDQVPKSTLFFDSQSTTKWLKSEKLYFRFPKAVELVRHLISMPPNKNSLILDYFAGSGTTAHAVINLNRSDNGNGKRKYILIEQGGYFDTVLKPRIQKAVYSEKWKNGKPIPSENGTLNGTAHIVKILKLESYEDTLNNLQLQNQSGLFNQLPQEAGEDYLLHYMLETESRHSLLSTDHFRQPFNYQMNIAASSSGAFKPTHTDLVETFNYLLGLTVTAIDDQRYKRGFVFVEGTLPRNGEKTLIIWRDCTQWHYENLPQLLGKRRINPTDNEYGTIYINGDHNIATVWDDATAGSLKLKPIEPEFLRLMFETEEI